MQSLKIVIVTAVAALFGAAMPFFAQGTAFTYQGRLKDGGGPANGSYDLRFALFDASAGGTISGVITNSATMVSNGIFNVMLDFGAAFNGSNFWLEIAAHTNGAKRASRAGAARHGAVTTVRRWRARRAGVGMTGFAPPQSITIGRPSIPMRKA